MQKTLHAYNNNRRFFSLTEVGIRLSAYNQPPLTCMFANTFPANIHHWSHAAPMSVSDWFDRTAQRTLRVISFNDENGTKRVRSHFIGKNVIGQPEITAL